MSAIPYPMCYFKERGDTVMANESMEGISAVIATFYSVFQNVYETFSGE